MEETDLKNLFLEIHPGFFEREHIRTMPEDETFHEMILRLDNHEADVYPKKFPKEISFGFYSGDLSTIRDIVLQVEPDWSRYFDGKEPVYCGFYGGRPVSFCLITDYGLHNCGNRTIRIGGPGCVGTLPAFRDRGIGLTMVNRVTHLLCQQGFDYAYIHYTSEETWYAKLGYQTCLRWNCNGFVE